MVTSCRKTILYYAITHFLSQFEHSTFDFPSKISKQCKYITVGPHSEGKKREGMLTNGRELSYRKLS